MQAPEHPLNISIIGAGNVGHHMALYLFKAGYRIHQICSRNVSAYETASRCRAEVVNRVSDMDAEADVYLLCVNDDKIAEVALQLNVSGKLLLHTSASVDTVPVFTDNLFGVLYPLQTFSREVEVEMSGIPVFVNAENPEALQTVKRIAESLSEHVYVITDEVRRALHVAAVFANNFTNLMYNAAEEICTKNKLPFDVLKPLISQTTMKALLHPPHSVQTGPAVRGDVSTIHKHIAYIQENHMHLTDLYQICTQIIQHYKKHESGE